MWRVGKGPSLASPSVPLAVSMSSVWLRPPASMGHRRCHWVIGPCVKGGEALATEVARKEGKFPIRFFGLWEPGAKKRNRTKKKWEKRENKQDKDENEITVEENGAI